MKFFGLILICAASTLALLLPGLGVVHFPPQNQPSLFGRLLGYAPRSSPAPIWASHQSDESTAIGLDSEVMPWSSATAPSLRSTPLSFPNTETSPSENQFGLGIWLFLFPVGFVGLLLWTLGPNPAQRYAK